MFINIACQDIASPFSEYITRKITSLKNAVKFDFVEHSDKFRDYFECNLAVVFVAVLFVTLAAFLMLLLVLHANTISRQINGF